LACEILDIRQLDAHQFTPLLKAESRAWREDLHWDFSASARLIATCLEEKRLSGYALMLEDEIKGYCFFFYDGTKGLIGDLFTDPADIQIDQVRRLLEYSLERLIGTPALLRVEAQLPHFSFEQLEPCFRAHCFEGYRRRFMSLALAKLNAVLAEPAESAQDARWPADFLIQPWERRHDRDAAQLLYCAYRHHVDTAINDQYGSATGTSRLIENIVHHAGCGRYLPQASVVAIHRSTQQLAGVLALTAVGPHNAHIPQIAIAGQFQGAGLGTAMLNSSFQELIREGHSEVSLTVTDLNAGALRLYERLGFETFRPFGAFVWNHPS
jgi:ribosomal protein S18 acetylase RimI-like enzyme